MLPVKTAQVGQIDLQDEKGQYGSQYPDHRTHETRNTSTRVRVRTTYLSLFDMRASDTTCRDCSALPRFSSLP